MMEVTRMEMKQLHDKMKMQVGQVLEQHHLQNSNPLHKYGRVNQVYITKQIICTISNKTEPNKEVISPQIREKYCEENYSKTISLTREPYLAQFLMTIFTNTRLRKLKFPTLT